MNMIPIKRIVFCSVLMLSVIVLAGNGIADKKQLNAILSEIYVSNVEAVERRLEGCRFSSEDYIAMIESADYSISVLKKEMSESWLKQWALMIVGGCVSLYACQQLHNNLPSKQDARNRDAISCEAELIDKELKTGRENSLSEGTALAGGIIGSLLFPPLAIILLPVAVLAELETSRIKNLRTRKSYLDKLVSDELAMKNYLQSQRRSIASWSGWGALAWGGLYFSYGIGKEISALQKKVQRAEKIAISVRRAFTEAQSDVSLYAIVDQIVYSMKKHKKDGHYDSKTNN